MIDKNNKPKILEINPRPSGSTSIALSAGIHLLDNVLEKYKKEKIIREKSEYDLETTNQSLNNNVSEKNLDENLTKETNTEPAEIG